MRVVTGSALTEKRTRVRPAWSSRVNGATSAYFVVHLSWTSASHCPKNSTARSQDPVRWSSADGSV